MMNSYQHLYCLLAVLILAGCGTGSDEQKNGTPMDSNTNSEPTGIMVAKLRSDLTPEFQRIRDVFRERNPGYDLQFSNRTTTIRAEQSERVLFIQSGGGTAIISSGDTSKISVGDIVMLHPGEEMETDSLIAALAFTVPDPPPAELPRFIRPDWDPHITDIPGGCATETGAYRRILLTWLGKVGPYLFHSLNAHRVRIMDSFTHYHPQENGFDEFYLVQMVLPGARIITGDRVDLVENYEQLERSQVAELLQETPLEVGDLVYLPRGTIHRGIGGVLAQVITVPGFVPGSEIGVDYHLRLINEKFKLIGSKALPFNIAASDSVVVK